MRAFKTIAGLMVIVGGWIVVGMIAFGLIGAVKQTTLTECKTVHRVGDTFTKSCHDYHHGHYAVLAFSGMIVMLAVGAAVLVLLAGGSMIANRDRDW